MNNLHQPSDNAMPPPPPLSSNTTANVTNNNRRRTRTRSSGSYNDNNYPHSSEEEEEEDEEIVDHVSALLMSRQQQQQQQQQTDDVNNDDLSSIGEKYNDNREHKSATAEAGGELMGSSFSSEKSHRHDDPPIVEYDTSYDDDEDDVNNYHHENNTSGNDSNNNHDDDDDDANLLSAQQNRLRELMAQSDDCWGADLSEDEIEVWNGGGSDININKNSHKSNHVSNEHLERKRVEELAVNHKQMPSASAACCDDNSLLSKTASNKIVVTNSNNDSKDDAIHPTVTNATASSTPTRETNHRRNNDGSSSGFSSNTTHSSSSINIQNINYRHHQVLQQSSPLSSSLRHRPTPQQQQPQQQQPPQQMSLQNPRQQHQLSAKEQLLQQRIRHQQRLHRKHSNEQQKVSLDENKKTKESSGGFSSAAAAAGGGYAMAEVSSADRIRQLTAKSSTKSGLFPEEEDDDDDGDDDDNSSIIVSNGSGMNIINSSSKKKVQSASSSSSSSSSSPSRRSSRRQQHSSSSSSPPPSSSLSSLHSLPSRPTCQSFPDEADRKRIVGCLAAILASSYTHETAPHLMVKKESSSSKQQPSQQQQQCYEEHQQLLQQQQQRYYEKQEQSQQQERDSPINDSSIPASSNDGGTNSIRPSFDLSLSSSSVEAKDDTGVTSIKLKPQHHQNVGNNHPLSIDPTTSINHHHQVLQPHKQQQQLIRQSSTNFNSNNGSATTSPTQHGSSISKNNTTKASFHQSFTSSINNSIQKASLSTTSSTQPPSKLKDELAEIRHRIRRHAIYSELLVSSADLLLLDSSHAKAFLPMLEGLLTKVEVEDLDNTIGGGNNIVGNDSTMGTGSSHGGQQQRQSWKGRGFGGGGVVVDSDVFHQQQAASMERSKHDAPPAEAATKPLASSRARSNSVPRHDHQPSMKLKAEKNGEMNEKELESSSNGVDLYESLSASSAAEIPTASRSVSSPSAPPSTPPPYAPLETVMVDKELIAPFLQTLTPGAGFSCIALLLLNHLLRDGRGYDARVRQAFKRLAVVVLSHELKVGGILRVDLEEEDDLDSTFNSTTHQPQPNSHDDGTLDDADELSRLAARKFEAMEHTIAAKLIAMSGESAEVETDTSASRGQGSSASRSHSQSAPPSVNTTPNSSTHGGRIALAPKEPPTSSQHGISREQLLRGIKVGTAGAVGATLFALTGGLAAPGIAAGLAAVAGGSALAAGVTTVLSSAAAITTIFGVGGAGLAGYKMHRRTKGLTEFDFQKEQLGKNSEAELFSTVCISGWLRDARDFQRPWGVSPSHPRIIDKQELLERFYFIHNPDNVPRVPEILKHWKGRYFQLWRALKEKYGADPSNLFPLRNGPRINAKLTHEEGLSVDFLMDELGYTPKKKAPLKEKKSHFFGMKSGSTSATGRQSSSTATRPTSLSPKDPKQLQSAQRQLTNSTLKKKKGLLETIGVNSSELASSLSLFSESETNSINDNSTHTAGSIPDTSSRGTSQRQAANNSNDVAAVKPPPKHLLTVWDYHANYGGELYTVRWESDLLMELCDSVADQMIEWGVSATKTILHTTVFATLMTAVTLPYSLVLAANAIDSSWTMATERADRAGVELAKNLIDSNAGHRPVVLVGFSMGARVVYSCLKELSRHQEIWEDHQQKKKLPPSKRKQKDTNQTEEQLKYIREPASIVEDAILMGTPNHISIKSWEASRRVVAGRLVNCYSRKDLILSLMFQMKKFQGILRAICGTSPVTVNGVENYDVTDLVTGHTDYCLVSGEILKRVRHGQPQRASVSGNEVMAMVTTIKVANNDFSLASLADEAERSSK